MENNADIVVKQLLRVRIVKKVKMTLIKSISGIRGTLENIPGESLSDIDVQQFTLAYFQEIILPQNNNRVVVGRDARKSGKKISNIVSSTLSDQGCDVIDIGMVTTPTLGIYTKKIKASGGIMISASHNDERWNALKLLNSSGEFLSPKNVELVIRDEIRKKTEVKNPGNIVKHDKALDYHIDLILSQKILMTDKIKKRNFKIAVDGINSVGGVALPLFLRSLGVDKIHEINCKPNGMFAHNPEPLPENIKEICDIIKNGDFDLGLVVDPDADRLCLVDEQGTPFGEEYTLVAAAEFLLSKINAPVTCSNLSSSLALKKITKKHGGSYYCSPVGEINVVEKMKKVNASIGGEGNGGVIYPKTHYGRDSLIGTGMILSLLAEKDKPLSEIKNSLPSFHIVKSKTTFNGSIKTVIDRFKTEFSKEKIDLQDGIRIDFKNSWVHIRKSNTEPVMRIISEAPTIEESIELSKKIISKLHLV